MPFNDKWKEEIIRITFDSIVKQLNMVRDWFVPYDINKKYYLINDISRIFRKIESDRFKERENQTKLIID